MAGNSSPTVGMQPDGDGDSERRPAKRRRIPMACGLCRMKKTRCDGTRPVCQACREIGADCQYPESAMPSASGVLVDKHHLSSLYGRLERLEHAVVNLTDRLDNVDATAQTGHAPSQPPVDVGNEEHDTDAMGAVIFDNEVKSSHFGPSSNIFFLRAIAQVMLQASSVALSSPSNSHQQSRSTKPADPPELRAAYRSSNGHAVELPTQDDEAVLLNSFFVNTGYLFPYVHEGLFRARLESMRPRRQKSASWLALLNIVLAMSISTSHGSGLSATQRQQKSEVYAQRALHYGSNRMMQGANLETAHFCLLLGLYLQGTQKPSEAWTVSGLVVKIAFQLGLHTSTASAGLPALEQEIRKRTWLGCLSLDRTMSMTFGRPPAIPSSYVRAPEPAQWPPTELGDPATPMAEQRDPSNVGFFAATIKLYGVVAVVLERLYGQNLDYEDPLPTSDVITRIFEIEGSVVQWERSLPENMAIISASILVEHLEAGKNLTSIAEQRLKLRTILTLRYLNARLLLHRPILLRRLKDVHGSDGSNNDNVLLQQVGANSISTSLTNAAHIISLVQESLSTPRDVLGAWWFTLYYTFNAALTIFACFLVCQNSPNVAESTDSASTINKLSTAIRCLELLDKENQTVDRCRHCLQTLVDATTRMAENATSQNQEYLLDQIFYSHDLGLDMGLGFGDLFDGGEAFGGLGSGVS